MSSIEHLITPQYVYSNIVEHLRSQLNMGTLDSSDLSDLEITRIEIMAFSTRYHFSIHLEREEGVQSSIIELGDAEVSKVVKRLIVGRLEEILEPGAERPTFDFQAAFVD